MPRKNSTPDKPVKKSYKNKNTSKRSDDDDVKPDFKYDFILKDPELEEKKVVPGKNRFFEQNYQHPVYTKDDGYKIAYQLCVKFEDFKKIQRLLEVKDINKELEPHVLEFLRDGFLVHDSWERFEKDLCLISSKLKKILIKVKCIAEDFSGITDGENDNLYIYYAKNGKAYSAPAEIIFPPFDETLLMQ